MKIICCNRASSPPVTVTAVIAERINYFGKILRANVKLRGLEAVSNQQLVYQQLVDQLHLVDQLLVDQLLVDQQQLQLQQQ